MKTKTLIHWRVTFWVEIFFFFLLEIFILFMSLITCLKRLKKHWGDWAHKCNLFMTHQNLGCGLAFSWETWWRAQKRAPYLSEVMGPLPPSGSRRWSPLRCWRPQAPLPPAGVWPPRDPPLCRQSSPWAPSGWCPPARGYWQGQQRSGLWSSRSLQETAQHLPDSEGGWEQEPPRTHGLAVLTAQPHRGG